MCMKIGSLTENALLFSDFTPVILPKLILFNVPCTVIDMLSFDVAFQTYAEANPSCYSVLRFISYGYLLKLNGCFHLDQFGTN